MKKIHFLHLKNTSIYDQLQIEEALLRADQGSFCIINEGSSQAIVMGISGKPEELVEKSLWEKNPIPLIKRFSGGGCVLVDHNTLFVTFIFSKELVDIPVFPEPILRWSERFYQSAFEMPEFTLRENDYVVGKHKLGGNAQYIKKGRWLHHTSFLWDYNPQHMNMLSFPKKTPSYRKNRAHNEFLCKLKDHLSDKDQFINGITTELSKRFEIKSLSLEEALKVRQEPHRKSTQFLQM